MWGVVVGGWQGGALAETRCHEGRGHDGWNTGERQKGWVGEGEGGGTTGWSPMQVIIDSTCLFRWVMADPHVTAEKFTMATANSGARF